VAGGEPLWTDEDRDWAMALLAVEADRCEGCGHQRSESMSIKADSGYRAEKARCHACKAIAEASERWADDSKGLFINLSKIKTR
jgi:hypothetical protein